MTARTRFSQADLTRALRAFEKAGVSVAGGKIAPDGTITILAGNENNDEDWRAGSPLYERRA